MSENKKYTLLKDIQDDSSDNVSEYESEIEYNTNSIKVNNNKHKNIITSIIVFVLVYISLYITKLYNLYDKNWSIILFSTISSILYYFFNIFL